MSRINGAACNCFMAFIVHYSWAAAKLRSCLCKVSLLISDDNQEESEFISLVQHNLQNKLLFFFFYLNSAFRAWQNQLAYPCRRCLIFQVLAVVSSTVQSQHLCREPDKSVGWRCFQQMAHYSAWWRLLWHTLVLCHHLQIAATQTSCYTCFWACWAIQCTLFQGRGVLL